MEKFLQKSVYKRVLIVFGIYSLLIVSGLFLTTSNYGEYSVGSVIFGYVISLVTNVLIIIAFIFGYLDMKKTFKSVSLKDLVLMSLLLSFLFTIIGVLISYIFLKITLHHYLLADIWYINILPFVIYFLLYWIIIYFISLWKIFERAGEEGWKSLIPFYNIIILLKITEKPDWWFFFFLIPIVNIIFACMVNFELAKKFNKYDDFALGTAILPIIFYPIIAFGKDDYQK